MLGQIYTDAAKNFDLAPTRPTDEGQSSGFWGSSGISWFLHAAMHEAYAPSWGWYFVHPAIRLVNLITLEEVEVWPYNNSGYLLHYLCDRLSTTTSYSNTHSPPLEPSSSWFVGSVGSSSLETAYGMWVAAYIPSQVTGGRSHLHTVFI